MVCLGFEPRQQDGRHRRIHRVMAAPPEFNCYNHLSMNCEQSIIEKKLKRGKWLALLKKETLKNVGRYHDPNPQTAI